MKQLRARWIPAVFLSALWSLEVCFLSPSWRGDLGPCLGFAEKRLSACCPSVSVVCPDARCSFQSFSYQVMVLTLLILFNLRFLYRHQNNLLLLEKGKDLDLGLLHWEELILRSQVLSIQMSIFNDSCLHPCLGIYTSYVALTLRGCCNSVKSPCNSVKFNASLIGVSCYEPLHWWDRGAELLQKPLISSPLSPAVDDEDVILHFPETWFSLQHPGRH